MVKFSSVFLWATAPTTICLELGLLFIAYRRRLYRQLVFFSAYIVVTTVAELGGWWVIYSPWHETERWRYVYWSLQFALSLLRLLTIAEISRRSLGKYPLVWTFASRFLAAVAAILLFWTARSAIQNLHHFRKFIMAGDQRFECMQAILLLVLLMVVVYYRVALSPLFRLVLIGIGIYSSLQVANDQLGIINVMQPNSILDYIRRGTYIIPLSMWVYAVWRWGANSNTQPKLLSQSAYDDLSPQIHDRLRELNDKLSDLVGKRPR
jgi:hypothetical protein